MRPIRQRAIAAAAAIAVLRKFNMSLFRIPGASSVAPSTLSASEPTVAPTTTRAARRRDQAHEHREPRRGSAPATPAGGSFERHRAGRSRRHAFKRRDRDRSPAPRLADLAGDRVAPAGGERRRQTPASAGSRASVSDRHAAPRSPRRRCWRSRCLAPRRPPRSSAIPSSVLRRRPRRELIEAARNVASSSTQPCQPSRRRSRCR